MNPQYLASRSFKGRFFCPQIFLPFLWFSAAPAWISVAQANDPAVESPGQAQARHEKVSARRASLAVICHRGASEFAHENTLEAYRATFELGADGNEIDIRETRDGVLVCFHDSTIETQLRGFGEIADYTFEDLRRFPFRESGRFRPASRIRT